MDGPLTIVETEDAFARLSPARDALEIRTPEGYAAVPLSPSQAANLVAAGSPESAPREIERRFLLQRLPDLPDLGRALRQGYFLVREDASLRIRRSGDRERLTFKQGRGLARTESEIDLEPEQAAALWPLTGDRVVVKTRYRLPDGRGTLEVDLYHGRHEGLRVVEREFSNLEEAQAWVAPGWARPEVTHDPRYTAARLALGPLPTR